MIIVELCGECVEDINRKMMMIVFVRIDGWMDGKCNNGCWWGEQ